MTRPFLLALCPSIFATATWTQDGCAGTADVELVGLGTVGSSGVPTLSMGGAPLEGFGFSLGVHDALPGAHGCFLFSQNEAPLLLPQFGAVFYPSAPLLTQVFEISTDGEALEAIPTLPVLTAYCGVRVTAQAVVLDPAAQGGVAFTKAVRVGFGPDPGGVAFPAVSSSYAVGEFPRSVAIGDLNGDQVPDLVVANDESSSVSVLLGTGDGTFGPAATVPAGDAPGSAIVVDTDGDHVLDLVVTKQNTDEVSVMLGNGDGTFGVAVEYAVGDRPYTVAADDLNGDLVTDLVVANVDSNDVSVLLGVGDGTFAPAPTVTFFGEAFFVATGDLNGDSIPDLVIGEVDSMVAFSDRVQIRLGAGDGTFLPAQYYAAGTSVWSLAIGDLDQDGDEDVAVANLAVDEVSILLGNGDGSLAAPHEIPVGDIPRSIAITDANRDGIPDLVVVHSISDDVLVLLGQGGGIFQPQPPVFTGGSPFLVAAGDLNGDLLPDLAVAGGGDDSVAVFLSSVLD